MDGWITFWGWTLITVLVIYTAVAVMVAIGGLYDIKALLKALGSKDSADASPDDQREEFS